MKYWMGYNNHLEKGLLLMLLMNACKYEWVCKLSHHNLSYNVYLTLESAYTRWPSVFGIKRRPQFIIMSIHKTANNATHHIHLTDVFSSSHKQKRKKVTFLCRMQLKLQYDNIFPLVFTIEYLSLRTMNILRLINTKSNCATPHQTKPNETTQYTLNSGLDTVNKVLSE